MGRLFWKFFVAILLAQIAAMLGVGATFWVWDQARTNASATGAARIDTSQSAEAILASAALTLKYGGQAGLRELAAGTGHRQIFVIDGGGKDLLGRSVGAALHDEAERLAGGRGVRLLTAADGARFTVFLQRADGPFGAGGAEARLRMPPPGLFSAAPPPKGPGGMPPSGRRMPYITMVVGILASFLFAALLAWYFSRPIRALRAAFDAAASGDLSPRFSAVKHGRGDELADLGHDFDRMSNQLRALMDNQRRLLHDVSHELRSPLARLQAAVGLAHQQPEKLGVSLERIERESVRMDKLVGELLTLSRLESASQLLASDNIAILEMVDEIAEDASFEAASEGLKVVVTGTTAAQVRGSPDLLWRAVENVVRNAIKHSARGGVVEIALQDAGSRILVQVSDRGPGVEAGDLENIFHAFYRSNPLANNIDGHGLGLAIARRVIDAHAGTISARNRDGGGLQVTIALPATA